MRKTDRDKHKHIFIQESVHCSILKLHLKYRRSSGYDSLDLPSFEVTNAPHKNIKDNNIKAIKLDYCDKELQ